MSTDINKPSPPSYAHGSSIFNRGINRRSMGSLPSSSTSLTTPSMASSTTSKSNKAYSSSNLAPKPSLPVLNLSKVNSRDPVSSSTAHSHATTASSTYRSSPRTTLTERAQQARASLHKYSSSSSSISASTTPRKRDDRPDDIVNHRKTMPPLFKDLSLDPLSHTHSAAPQTARASLSHSASSSPQSPQKPVTPQKPLTARPLFTLSKETRSKRSLINSSSATTSPVSSAPTTPRSSLTITPRTNPITHTTAATHTVQATSNASGSRLHKITPPQTQTSHTSSSGVSSSSILQTPRSTYDSNYHPTTTPRSSLLHMTASSATSIPSPRNSTSAVHQSPTTPRTASISNGTPIKQSPQSTSLSNPLRTRQLLPSPQTSSPRPSPKPSPGSTTPSSASSTPTSQHSPDAPPVWDEPGLINKLKHPITPATALKHHLHELTQYECSEVLDYQEVFFTGNPASKIRSTSSTNNYGYDDDRGDYLIVLHDHLGYRYEVMSMLGKGSFGQVVKTFDYKTGHMCAAKIIRNKKRFHHQALVELVIFAFVCVLFDNEQILEHLKEHDPTGTANIIHMSEYFYFRNHLCITFELLSINLYEFIKANKFQGFSLGLIRRFGIQLLYSLRFLSKRRIIHADLKPENILLKQPTKSGIKVIDFDIQSRFYRSPEIILGLPYDKAIDVWSLGCILAELYTGYPLFPGENETEQLLCTMEVLGLPPKSLVEASPRKKLFFDSTGMPKVVPNSRGKKRRPGSKTLAQALKCSDRLFLDFLEGCLKWDPAERMTPEEGLKHSWILEALTQNSTSTSSSSTTSRTMQSASARVISSSKSALPGDSTPRYAPSSSTHTNSLGTSSNSHTYIGTSSTNNSNNNNNSGSGNNINMTPNNSNSNNNNGYSHNSSITSSGGYSNTSALTSSGGYSNTSALTSSGGYATSTSSSSPVSASISSLSSPSSQPQSAQKPRSLLPILEMTSAARLKEDTLTPRYMRD